MTTVSYVPGMTMVKPLFDKNKGGTTNRVQCAGEQSANTAVTGIKASAVIGGGVGLAALTKKFPGFKEALDAPIKLAGKALLKFTEAHPDLPKTLVSGIGKLSNVAKGIKCMPIAAAIAAPLLLAGILLKNAFRQGQIDQKYTDRAQVLKHSIG